MDIKKRKSARAAAEIVPVFIPTPFPIGDVNAYIIKGDPPTLVDCGPDTPSAREKLKSALAGEGLAMEDIGRIILTHFHTDHSGMCRYIRGVSKADVYAHPADSRYLVEDSATVMDKWAGRIEALFQRAGVPGGPSGSFAAALRKTGPSVGGIGEINFIEDGHQFDYDNLVMTVRHTPGHSPGSIILYLAGEGMIMSGDTFLERVSPNPLVELDDRGRRVYSSLIAYLKTLDLLEALDWERSLPGHGLPFTRMGPLFGQRKKEIRDRSSAVESIIRDAPRDGYAVATALFGELAGGRLFLAVSEAVSHLDLLAAGGRAVMTEDGGHELYSSAETAAG